MKKIISLLLSLLMIVSCFAITVSAEEVIIGDGYGFALAIDNVDAKIGDTVTVKITATFADTGICGGEFRVKYPTDRLTLVLEEPNEDEETPGSPCWLFGAAAANGTISTNTPGEVYGTYAAIKNSKKSGDFFEMKFIVNEGAYGKTDIVFGTVSFDTMGDDDESVAFACQTYNGSVYVEGAPVTPTYDVTFDANLEGVVSPEAKTDVEANTEIDLPVFEDTADYKFVGWKEADSDTVYTDKYTVTKTVALVAVWDQIVKYTVSFSEGADAVTVVAGESVTLPTLTDDELSFKGWKVGDTDEILAGGASFVPTVSVFLTAVWGGGKKIYIDATGDDANDGLTQDKPIKTLKRAQEILLADAKADNTLDTIVIVSKYEKKNEAAANTDNFLNGIGKKIYIVGLTTDSIFDMHYYSGTNSDGSPKAVDSHMRIAADIEFDNLTLVASGKDGGIMSMGYDLTFGENYISNGTQGTGHAHYNDIYKDGGIINIENGSFGNVHYAGMSGAKLLGTTTTNINGGNIKAIYNGHGWRNNNIAYGVNYININDGEVGLISLNPCGTASVTSYAGLRYFTINGGTVGNVTTTGIKQASYKDGDNTKYVNSDFRDGVTVFEINGGTVGTFAAVGDGDDATRVIINNTANALTVEDTGAIVINVKNGKIHAETTGFDAEGKPTYVWNMKDSAVLDWAKTVELTGFSYEADDAYNAVKVGEETYILADLEDGLIPAPESAGAYDVEFFSVFTVIVNGVEYLAEEGDVISLTRLPQNGDLKHIGWATTEDATEATINHTADYIVTSDVTLYPVWAEAVYFTAAFETARGTAPEAITVIDDDEDGKADTAITFPGYDGKVDEHYTFVAWTDGVNDYEAGAEYTLEADVTFTAKWAEDPYVIFNATVEAGAAEAVEEKVYGVNGEAVTAPVVSGKEHYTFKGWALEGTTEIVENIICGDETVTYVAIFEEDPKVTVTIIDGEETVATVADYTGFTYTFGILANKPGFRFVGYKLEGEEAATVFAGDEITVTADVTYYAVREEIQIEDAEYTFSGNFRLKSFENGEGSGRYIIKMYYVGPKANMTAFGFAYSGKLQDVSVVYSDEFQSTGTHYASEDGYYVDVVYPAAGGTFGDDAKEPVLLATIAATMTAEDYTNLTTADFFKYINDEEITGAFNNGEWQYIMNDDSYSLNVESRVYPIYFTNLVDNKNIEITTTEVDETVAVDGIAAEGTKFEEITFTVESTIGNTIYVGYYVGDVYMGDLEAAEDGKTYTIPAEYVLDNVKIEITTGIEIKNVDIIEIEAPEAQGTPDIEAAISGEDAHFEIVSVEWNPADEEFGFDTEYTVKVVLAPEAEYAFTTNTVYTINGETAALVENAGEGKVAVYYTFPATVKELGNVSVIANLVRDAENAAYANFGTITVLDENDVEVASFTEDDSVGNVLASEFELLAGTYTVVIAKNGYLTYTTEVTVVYNETSNVEVELIAGNLYGAGIADNDNGVIDLEDFVAITSAFSVKNEAEMSEEETEALKAYRARVDVNEDGIVTVDDLMFVKASFGDSEATYTEE